MNTWELRKTAIVEADDFMDRYDRNGLNFLFYWKSKYPNFKITLFTIPDRTSTGLLYYLVEMDWIEFAVHGWNHESNFECYGWDYEKTRAFMNRIGEVYKPIFKAPGWSITDKYNGYPADKSLPIAKDPQAIYKALNDINYVIIDRHYNKPARLEGGKYICIDCNPNIVHLHTWDMVTGDLQGKNGFRQAEEEHGVPWDNNTEFYFISEAYEKGLILPCKS